MLARVPVRVAERADREGDAFWCGPRAKAESAAAGEDCRSARSSQRRPGLAGYFPPQPQPPPPPLLSQTLTRRVRRNARSLGPAGSGWARIRGSGGESRYLPPAPCRAAGNRNNGDRLGTQPRPLECGGLGQQDGPGGLGREDTGFRPGKLQ